jgi:site-specific recombinase XerD
MIFRSSWRPRAAKCRDMDAATQCTRYFSSRAVFEAVAHSLREAVATNALDHLADSAKVQVRLGHANIR